MNKLEKTHFQSAPTHACRCSKNTCDTHACSRGIGQFKQTKFAYTSAYVHPHARVYTCICIQIHRHTYLHIHTYEYGYMHVYMHTHIHMHVFAHLHTDRNSQQRRLNASNHIIDTYMHPYTYACINTYICIYIYVHTCSECVADVYVDDKGTSV